MTEQQGTPDQLPAEKGQGGAGATYKVHEQRFYSLCKRIPNIIISFGLKRHGAFCGPHPHPLVPVL